jgi:hypothetical protein
MKRPVLFFGMLALLMVPVLAQTDPEAPTTLIEWISRFPEMIGSFWGVFVSVVLLVPILIGVIPGLIDADKVVKYLFTGVLALTLILLARFLPIGYLYDATFWGILLDYVFILAMQIVGYTALKPAHDAISEKFTWWRKTPPTG